jgi:hypothetical protein
VPIPSSRPELEYGAGYEPVLIESTIFSNQKAHDTGPIDLTLNNDSPPQESSTVSSTEKMELSYAIPIELNMKKDTPIRGNTEFSTVETIQDESELHTVTTRSNASTDFTTIGKIQLESEFITTTTREGKVALESTALEKTECEPRTRQEISPTKPPLGEDKPLDYGDLVIVEYAEKKKAYKWPAIVLLLFTSLIEACAAWTHDG